MSEASDRLRATLRSEGVSEDAIAEVVPAIERAFTLGIDRGYGRVSCGILLAEYGGKGTGFTALRMRTPWAEMA